jgi:Domain of unknown function (DUF4352)
MSDVQQGPGWWQTSDGNWDAPELHPEYQPPPRPVPEVPSPGWWLATDGQWYPPELHPNYQAPAIPVQLTGASSAIAAGEHISSGSVPSPQQADPPTKKRTGLIVAGSIVGAIILILIIMTATSSKKITPIAGGSSSTVATSAFASTATTATTKPVTAHVGATLSLSGQDGAAAEVTLTQVINPATGSTGPPTGANGNPNGASFVATLVTLKNTGSSALQGNANDDSTLIGSNNQSYTADFDAVRECTNFSSGSYHLTPGASATSCVVFVMPVGVTPAKFQYSPNSGFSNDFGEWLIP